MIALLWIGCAACGGAALGLGLGFRCGASWAVRMLARDCLARCLALGIDPRVWLLVGEKPVKPEMLQ